MVVTAAVTAVASIGSSIVGSNAASSAARKQAAAANNATATQQAMFNQSEENLQPYIDQGHTVSDKISQLEGLNGSDPSGIQNALASLPGYQFANTQGLKAVQNSASERGLGISGAAQKGAAQFATGNANTYYGNYLTGLQNTQNTDANAANGLANTSATVGANIAGTQMAAGNALAQGTLNSAGQIQGGINGVANSAVNGLQNAFYANKILGSQQGGGGSGSANGIYQNNPLGLSAGSNFTNNDISKITQDFADGA